MHKVYTVSRRDCIGNWKREPIGLTKSNYTTFRTTCEQKIVENRFFLAGVGRREGEDASPIPPLSSHLLTEAVEDSNLR